MAERLPKYTIDELYFEEMAEDEAVVCFKTSKNVYGI